MAGPRYVADALSRTVPLDGLVAYYHAPSGQTHLLAAPAPQILEAIMARPSNLSEIRTRISETYEVRGAEAELQSRLDELEAAGLVRRTEADICSPAKAGVQSGGVAGPRLSPGSN